MFVCFNSLYTQSLIPQEKIVKVVRFEDKVIIYYWDVSSSGEQYIENEEIVYTSKEYANKVWEEFLNALKSGEKVFVFDSDIK